jgi:hypothetical protein
MPRFFFDIHDGEEFTPDRQGLDLDDLEAAKEGERARSVQRTAVTWTKCEH